ncbi:subtilisin-like serine protease [Idiomarina sp. A28L]|uniref:S8 family serine peptidase n=1 Tax=Idiomarina sp. A28L TaxID=1036674 RepID=UPI0002138AE5|nr:S8 family serine peptidase [Idiomarina sp. A28L]EGN74297.1 subtilisin-like serine protease [Idiomarina sp. A28L]
MKNSFIPNLRPNLRLSLVAGAVLSVASAGVYASGLEQVKLTDQLTPLNQHTPLVDKVKDGAQNRVREENFYIVELEHAPIATYSGGVPGYAATMRSPEQTTRADVSSAAATNYRSFLVNEQTSFVNQLQSVLPQAQFVQSMQGLINAVIVELPDSSKAMAELAALPGVKRVYKNERQYAQMDASNSIINSAAAWEMVNGRENAGTNIRVAVIDSGILPNHPMFAANGHVRPAGLPNDDYCATTEPAFCNDKLIIARSYPNAQQQLHPQEVTTPHDVSGHGTHVAGTSVGNLVSTEHQQVALSFSGVAPGASLMAYKALFVGPDGRSSGFNSQLIGALEDAFNDGAHVINNSWGGGVGAHPGSSPYTSIFNSLEAAGVVVVTSAGNSGPESQTLGCPACAESGLAVANTQTGRTFGAPLSVSGLEMLSTVGNGDFTIDTPVTGPFAPIEEIVEENLLACETFTDSSVFDGHIIMVDRGECSFEMKANNLQSAGAIGMIMANNEAGVITMNMAAATLPGVSVTQANGESIREAWASGDTATLNGPQQIITPANVDIMALSSSRGPNADASFLKPDIAAPGTDILSAYPTESGYGAISGTSMASPHVAGAAAIVRQLRPSLNAFQVKSVLMTSSNPSVRMQNAVDQASPFDMGAGRLDIEAALSTAIAFDTASLSGPSCAPVCSFERTVTNLMSETTDWTVDFIPFDPNLDVSVSTSEITLEGGASATFEVEIDTTYAGEGWQFGHLVFHDVSSNYVSSIVPFAVRAVKSDNDDLVSASVISGPIVTGEEATLQARVNREHLDGTVAITVGIPDTAELIADSINPIELNVERTSLEVAADSRSFTWTGEFVDGVASAELRSNVSLPVNAGVSLRDIITSDPNQAPCSTVCDDAAFNFDITEWGGFLYNGVQYNTLNLSPNGYITAGSQNHAGSWAPQTMPDATPPNNVIAPLWADFIVGGTNEGALEFAIVNIDSDTWFVWEWFNVRTVDNANDRFTFSVWMKLGTDEIYFNYIDIPATITDAYSVGFEDVNGTIGLNYNGTLSNGLLLKAELTPGDSIVTLNYDVTTGLMGAAPVLTAAGAPNEAIAIDFSDLFTPGSHRGLSTVSVANQGAVYEAFAPLVVEAGDILSAAVLGQASHGNASVEDGQLVFTPASGRSGEFTFTYRVEDNAGRFTTPADVTVTVTNTAPVAAASSSVASIKAGNEGSLNASGSSDPDGDPLTYTWVQTGGPTAEISNANSASATFLAPRSNTATTLTFQVTVSDGELSDTASVSVELQRYSSKKWYEGSFGGLIVLLGLPLVWIRRRKHAKSV